jgi:hypothetical protein
VVFTGVDANSCRTPGGTAVGAGSAPAVAVVVGRGCLGAGSVGSTDGVAVVFVGSAVVSGFGWRGSASAVDVLAGPAVPDSPPTDVFAPPLALTLMSGTVGPEPVSEVAVDPDFVGVVELADVDGFSSAVVSEVDDPEADEPDADEPADVDPPDESDAPSSARATPAP